MHKMSTKFNTEQSNTKQTYTTNDRSPSLHAQNIGTAEVVGSQAKQGDTLTINIHSPEPTKQTTATVSHDQDHSLIPAPVPSPDVGLPEPEVQHPQALRERPKNNAETQDPVTNSTTLSALPRQNSLSGVKLSDIAMIPKAVVANGSSLGVHASSPVNNTDSRNSEAPGRDHDSDSVFTSSQIEQTSITEVVTMTTTRSLTMTTSNVLPIGTTVGRAPVPPGARETATAHDSTVTVAGTMDTKSSMGIRSSLGIKTLDDATTSSIREIHSSQDYTYGNVTSSEMIIVPGKTSGKMVAIVTPIMLGIVLLAVIAIVIVLVYRRKRRHRKKNIIKYKRYSQNGELSLPLTSISNDNYRSSRVSAHEEAVEYAQVDRTSRPPRPTYRYKTVSEEDTSLRTHSLWNTFPRHNTNNNVEDGLDTTLVDNVTYEATPATTTPPKVPVRKSSSEHGSLKRTPVSPKRTPASPKREISWPIPRAGSILGDSPVNGSVRSCSVIAPPLPPSPRRGPPSNRPAPPSPAGIRATSLTSRPVPPTPPSPRTGLPVLPPPPRPRAHEYDPVYVPCSDASAMNQRLDNAGYVTSRLMRMNALGLQTYEDVQLPAQDAASTRAAGQSSTSASPSRSHGSATTGPESPTSARLKTRSESDGGDVTSGDRSFDTLGTENSSRVNFSLEDIANVMDDSFGVHSTENNESTDVEYSVIPGEYSDDNTTNAANTSYDDSDDDKDSPYEIVNF